MPRDTSVPPLRPDDPESWDRLIDAVGVASMLVVIGAAMGDGLARRYTAEDVWQETLLQAWKDRDGFEWQGFPAFRRWLLVIARHRIADLADRDGAQKRNAETRAVSLDVWGSSVDDGHFAGPQVSTTPSRVAVAHEQAAVMRAALEALGDELRDVVHLRLFEGLTVREVAERLELGESAVRHRFRRGAIEYERHLSRAILSQSRADVRPEPGSGDRAHRDAEESGVLPEEG